MHYDVIVVGGGHAGCEAAHAAARMGARVALLTFARTNLGMMSCNPAIGGIGKGHLVREVDACDGLIARAADYAAIHYRMLNASRGPAVRGPRVQADRRRYRAAILRALEARPGLDILEGEAIALRMNASNEAVGVMLADGREIASPATVLATGTFLQARMHIGLASTQGGRVGERASALLAEQLRARLPMARLKTGTPPRLDGRTIDWAVLERQPSDGGDWAMSDLGEGRVAPQLACAITRTNPAAHAIVSAALDRSPLRSGAIQGAGPRYCPSIEDKIRRFGDRDGHQIFLEPEGVDDHLVYPNGISTSLPADAQTAFVRSIAGLERAKIVQPGYAVEYDHVDPRMLDTMLAVRDWPGLFLAGQINGTTGYEEAAAQGLVAGANAAARALGRSPVLFSRTDSYIGVMIDDLVLQGVSEPYRMLTSRAEHRLRLRADNSATRLGGMAAAAGLLGSERLAYQRAREKAVADLRTGVPWEEEDCGERRLTARQMASVAEEAEADAQYRPYVLREQRAIDIARSDENLTLPEISYASIAGISAEMVERLSAARPSTLGQAMRIRGITPAAVTALLVASRR